MNQIKAEGRDVISNMIKRYPQLTLDPAPGLKDTEEYRNIVRKGYYPGNLECKFRVSDKDMLAEYPTPAGNAEVLFLFYREDFERMVQMLAYKGENRSLPQSMGAVAIRGIVNWSRIHAHKKEYLQSGKSDWKAEFSRFTENPDNYKDSLIIISEGPYSNLPWEETPWSENEWLQYSKTIRIYHELAHFVSRKCFPQNRNALRDEVIADCIGLYQATGRYDAKLAQAFLGIDGDSYKRGGRLENYVKESEEMDLCFYRAKSMTEELDQHLAEFPETAFDVLNWLEEEKICFAFVR